jgi:hypothetical protein
VHLKTPYIPWSAWSVVSGRSHEAARVHHAYRRPAAGWPLAARARTTKIENRRSLATSSETEEEPFIRSLRSGLQELGYVEGGTVIRENHMLRDNMTVSPFGR